MGLFSTYGENNRVIDSDLQVRYTKDVIKQAVTYTSGTSIVTANMRFYEYHRYATKRMRYVGMTKTAADACAAALIAYFNRAVVYSTIKSDGTIEDVSGGQMVMANVAVNHVGGTMWEVSCDVSEDDARMTSSSLVPSVVFATENAREYVGV